MTPQPVAVIRLAASKQAAEMLDALEAWAPGLAARLRADPVGALRERDDLQIVWDGAATAGTCSVSGSYDPGSTPPTLRIAHAYGRRESFTVLHELGHHLQQSVDKQLAAAVISHPESDRFEEVSCETFAALVLLPDEAIEPVTPAKGASAETMAAYYETSRASRTACCVRALGTLVGGGVVAVLNEDGIVQYADSTISSVYPPKRGSDQSRTPLVARALSRPGETVTHDDTFIIYSTHDGTAVLYGQATWIDGWIVVVLKPDNVSWKGFAPPRPAAARATATVAPAAGRPAPWAVWETCTTCQDSFKVEEGSTRCPTCKEYRCANEHCGCTAKRELTCSGCHYVKGRAQFAAPSDPRPVCRECADG